MTAATAPALPASLEPEAPPPAGAGAGAGADTAAARPRWDSARLFGGADEIEIVHRGALYRMRITSLGKLILTK